MNSGAARLMVRVSVSEVTSRLCKPAFSRFHLATSGVEVQTVRSGVRYVVGSFSVHMCPAKAVSLASIWVRTYWRSLRSWAAQAQASFSSYSNI